MLAFQDALSLCLGKARPLGIERVPLLEAPGRVLAQAVFSDVDFPPFDKSAMDGFACQRASLASPLRIVETVAAGEMPTAPIGPGECSRIMTGAPVPPGANCVVMVEHTEILSDGTVRVSSGRTENNICHRGEDLRKGDLVVPAGKPLDAACVALLAGVGCTFPAVRKRPVVTVLATGSELVPAEGNPTGAQIRDSNSYQLCAQLLEMGIAPRHGGIVADTPEATVAAIRKAQQESDVILLSGGVSQGEFDHVPDALRALGFQIHFESVAMQPGRPTHFAESERHFCFGLPGNPVSTFVVFELLVKPFLRKMMDCELEPLFVKGVLGKPIRRKPTARQSTYPVTIRADGSIVPLDYHGAAHVHALSQAQALLTLPPHATGVDAGEMVCVRLLPRA